MSRFRPRIVLSGDQPRWVRWSWIGGVVAAAVIAGWVAFSFFAKDLSDRFEAASGDRARLLEIRRDLSLRLREEQRKAGQLREQLAYVEQSQMIDREACQRLRDALRELQAQLVDTQEQLAFYRGIVSPEEARGVRVHDLVFVPGDAGMRYELVLVHGRSESGRARGRVRVDIHGVRDGEADVETLRDLEGDADIRFSFRHFQEFSGMFRIPEGFEPERVRVLVTVDGRDEPVEVQYDWKRLVAG